jgi:hypothetical protein
LTVPNFGVGCVLSALAIAIPCDLPPSFQVWPPSVLRLSM